MPPVDAAGGAAAHLRPGNVVLPAPYVAEPGLRQDMDRGRVGAAIGHRDAHQDVVGGGLRILDLDVEVAILVEQAGVDQLVFGQPLAIAARILVEQVLIGKGILGQLVEHPAIGVARHSVEIIIELLDVLAVIALRVGKAEKPLLEDRILAVPEREPEAEKLAVVAEAGDRILAPAIGAAACLVVADEVPGIAIPAVILAHGAPLAIADIGAPAAPRLGAVSNGAQAGPFGVDRRSHDRVLPDGARSPGDRRALVRTATDKMMDETARASVTRPAGVMRAVPCSVTLFPKR